MKYIALFQAITRTDVKDCFEQNNQIIFVVMENQLGKAVGKGASKVKLIQNKLNKQVRVIEYKSEVKSFIKSLLFPLRIRDITEQDGIIEVTPEDIKTRGLMIGRNAQNLRNTEKIVQRFFDVTEIKIKNPQ